MTDLPHQDRACAAAKRWLQACLGGRLQPAAAAWLGQACEAVAGGGAAVLYTAFGAAPRRTGKSPLVLDGTEAREAAQARSRWDPSGWSVDEAARARLLLASDYRNVDAYVGRVDRLFATADAREMVALCRALPILPHGDRWCERAREGVRSNMQTVFEAVALHNPYPFEWFDEPSWNRMVLKAAFIGSPLSAILGLRERLNPTLRLSLCDLVSERRSAGRGIAPEVLQLLATADPVDPHPATHS